MPWCTVMRRPEPVGRDEDLTGNLRRLRVCLCTWHVVPTGQTV